MQIRNTSTTRQMIGVIQIRMALFTCLFVFVFSGCATYEPPCRKSIQDLYADALTASQTAMRQPEICASTMMTGEIYPYDGEAMHLSPAPMQDDLNIDATAPVQLDPAYDHEPLPVLPPPQTSALQPAVSNVASGPVRAVAFQRSREEGRWRRSGHGSVEFRPAARAVRPIRQISEASSAVLITEFLEDTDIRQALQAIASQAQVALIVDEQVTGLVTATIEDATFESALKTLLMPLGLIYRKVSEKEYLVGLPDPETALFARMSKQINFQPMHIPPTELVELLPDRQRSFVRPVDNRNYVLIEAPEEIAQSIADQLQRFDSPIPQVELEAIVCVVSPDQGFKSGLDWGHAVTLNGSELLNLGMQGLAFNGVGSVAGASNAFADFAVTSAFVKLLAQEGYLAIRAAPRVTARDGDQAIIKITRESFFSTQPQNDNNFFRQDIQQVEAGIELDITPIVRGDNITMKIEKAEVSEDIRTSSINTDITENPYPSINRRTVSTTVHVKDGETIVIGGLVQRQTVDRIARIPVLGNLPGLGKVFQTIEQTQQDAEVVIFISPKLVKPCL